MNCIITYCFNGQEIIIIKKILITSFTKLVINTVGGCKYFTNRVWIWTFAKMKVIFKKTFYFSKAIIFCYYSRHNCNLQS
ncbi:TPA: hypothetical protein MIO51_06170 [Klebsiella pneumoniae subsp. pneumoniae]|nr:hypothetical protein T653_06845 [Klebsiella pneumoniae MRSN 3852]PLH99485.1 hypothetical protein B6J40_23365 [Klebsiella pneumoniae]HBY0437315.1 hypothetical protein [Klebsiella pneumoniae subsp. pneumoniae]PLO07024.1 hypothetical protein CWN48_28870 [Klebsiella pneumoniae]HBX5906010.1 hypothetical protein [Klebsiella pneumoniae]